jgi:HAD superfamily hydrolase (TIGR01509 family)
MIRAVIFDLDGLLLDSEVYWEQARGEYCHSAGCEWRPQDELGVKGYNSREWAQAIRRRCNLAADPSVIIRAVTDSMRAMYGERLPLLPGAVDAVRRLAESYPLAVASSSPPELIEFATTRAGIRSCFAGIVSADSVERGKPAPDVFLAAASLLGVPSDAVAVFEDSTAGIVAGKAAGMRVIAIPNPHFPPSPEALRQADVVLGSLLELRPEILA